MDTEIKHHSNKAFGGVLPEQSNFHSLNDMSMVHHLLKTNPRYNIPEHLRNKLISTASHLMDNEDPRAQLSACKVLLEADKRNMEIVKMSIPQKKEIKNVTEQTTEELYSKLKELLINNPELIPVEVRGGQ